MNKPCTKPASQITIKNFLFFLFCFLPIVVSLKEIISGSIPFWYDPARDLLLALKNLQKPTLIGQETGIPGLFYGPYWIWSISLLLNFSKNPRFVVLLLQTIPYFIFFPWLLIKLSNNKTRLTPLMAWFFFIFAYKNYTTYLWNPHPTPLLFLALLFQISQLKLSLTDKKINSKLFLLGITSGLILNLHMSFGVAVLFALFLYLPALLKRKPFSYLLKRKLTLLTGLSCSFLPTFIFECRHGFNQTKAVLALFSAAIFQNSSIIGLSGLTHFQMLNSFLNRGAILFQLRPPVFFLIFIFLLLLILVRRKKFIKSVPLRQKKVLAFIFLTAFSQFLLYTSSKNPVWDYHFIGSEILFLSLFLIVIESYPKIRALALIWLLYLSTIWSVNFINSSKVNPLSLQSLAAKEEIVKTVLADSEGSHFTYFAYSPSIYTYDFNYLFQTLSAARQLPAPQKEIIDNQPVYLIIPETSQAIYDDFINYKTPIAANFVTVKQWLRPDNTILLKRVKQIPALENDLQLTE